MIKVKTVRTKSNIRMMDLKYIEPQQLLDYVMVQVDRFDVLVKQPKLNFNIRNSYQGEIRKLLKLVNSFNDMTRGDDLLDNSELSAIIGILSCLSKELDDKEVTK